MGGWILNWCFVSCMCINMRCIYVNVCTTFRDTGIKDKSQMLEPIIGLNSCHVFITPLGIPHINIYDNVKTTIANVAIQKCKE